MAMDSLYVSRNLRLESTSSLGEAEYVIIGIPFDSTSTNRSGSRHAPLEIRREFLGLEKEAPDLGGGSVFDVSFYDAGDVDVVPGNAAETLRRVAESVRDLRDGGGDFKPIVLGGEHLMTLGVVRALGGQDFTILSLDAHLDLRDDYMGEKLNHSTVMRRISEEGFGVRILGARSFSADEADYAKSAGIDYSGVADYDRILEDVKGMGVYLSIDFDVLEPLAAPGVGNPEPGGIGFNNLECVIDYVKSNCSVVGFDFMEVSPPFDNGVTAVYAAKSLIRALV
ncbi:MAG: agmatinase [Candidatus Altiarchaeota archaeon]